ncbi:hypothetical protein EVAR_38549_1 [Eumeta japonica]|uniref:Uncharacterized protein n=1 Tax=Eumeta variegata TaxID=151549 RepID=A0A4C1WEH1_EUMVA|nr:hypothetical protein EVAR_38549_1 [Eumeta japonica]
MVIVALVKPKSACRWFENKLWKWLTFLFPTRYPCIHPRDSRFKSTSSVFWSEVRPDSRRERINYIDVPAGDGSASAARRHRSDVIQQSYFRFYLCRAILKRADTRPMHGPGPTPAPAAPRRVIK